MKGGAVRHSDRNNAVIGSTPSEEQQYIEDDPMFEPMAIAEEPEFELSSEEKEQKMLELGFGEGDAEMLLAEFDYDYIMDVYNNICQNEGHNPNTIAVEEYNIKRPLAELTMEELYHPNNSEGGNRRRRTKRRRRLVKRRRRTKREQRRVKRRRQRIKKRQ
jgi:hypothetical protein